MTTTYSGDAIEIVVLEQSQYERGAGFVFDGTIDDVVESLRRLRASIPEEYRKTATCEISSQSDHGNDHYVTVRVAYQRSETEAERAARAAKYADAAQRELVWARGVYEAALRRVGVAPAAPAETAGAASGTERVT